MNINADDPKLTAFALGLLDGADRDAVAAQVKASPELTQIVYEIRQAADVLTAEFGATTNAAAGAGADHAGLRAGNAVGGDPATQSRAGIGSRPYWFVVHGARRLRSSRGSLFLAAFCPTHFGKRR